MPHDLKKVLSNSERLIIAGGLVLFCLSAVLAWIFWKERQAFDTAHYLLEIIIRKNFFIAHQRPVGIVSQVLPLAGLYLNLSLGKLMKLYSLGDIFYYMMIFSWLVFIARNYTAGLMLILTYFLTTYYSFYCPVTELLQGLALLPVIWVIIDKEFKGRNLLIVLLMAVVIFSHPLLFIPVGVLIGWKWLQKKEGRRLDFFLIIVFAVLTIFKLTLLDQYDYQKTYYPLVFNDYSNLNNLKDLPYMVLFLKMLITNYPISALIAIFTSIIFLIEKKFAEAFYFLLTVFGFLFLIAATHRFGGISNYSERMLLPLSFIIAFPFSIELLRLKNVTIRNLILVLLLVFMVFRVNETRKLSVDYTLRLGQMKNLINASRVLGYQKSVADEEILEQVPTANSGWCYSIESMILSSLDGPDKTVSIAMQHDHTDRLKAAGVELKPDEWIKWKEFILKDDTLPANYFRFRPQVYRALRNVGNIEISELMRISCKVAPVGISTKGDRIAEVCFGGSFRHVIPAKEVNMLLRYPGGEMMIPLATDILDGICQTIFLPSEIDLKDVEIKLVPGR